MNKIWLKSYPPGVPAEINVGEFSSLADLFDNGVRKFAERTAYIAQRTGVQTEEVELDLSRLAKNTADRAIAGLGRFVGTAKEIASGAKSSFQAGYLSALDD